MLRKTSAVLSFLLLFTLGLSAQEARYLAMEGEGTASIILDEPARVAYITDGGKGGSSGILGARIGGKPVLSHLLDKQVRHLVITCSHPHADHMDGLVAAVRDPEIQKFEEITFIDNEYEATTNRKSLHTIYEDAWGARGRPKVSYSSALNRDAFAGLARDGARVKTSNFVYDPKKIGAVSGAKGVHDRSVITQYEISARGRTVRLVDFDDSSSRLISAWAGGEPPPRLDVLVAPHHGSANNDLAPILDQREKLGLRDVIITVNRDNQYFHPSPKVLRRLVNELGPEHVFVTGSVIGDNVDVTVDGVRVTGGVEQNRQRLASLIELRLRHHAAAAEAQVDKVRSLLQGKVVLTHSLGGRPLDQAWIDRLAAQKVIPAAEIKRLRRAVETIEDLEASLDVVKPQTRRKPLLAVLGRGLDPLSFRSAASPRPSSGRDGVKRYGELYRRASGETDMGLPGMPSPGSGRPPGGPFSGSGGVSGGGDGGGRMGASGNGSSSRPGGISPSGPSGSGGGGSTMFRQMLTRRVPLWGGIILGNDPEPGGSRPSNLQFVAVPDPGAEAGESDESLILRVLFKDGSSADYTGLTPTEIWAAYNFVQPSAELQEEYGELGRIPGNAAGLVGMTKNLGDAWEFAVHPAIADTALARHAMRVDMMISVARKPGSVLPASFKGVRWAGLRFQTYQWYDAPARIRVRGGQIEVEPASGNRDCLMRVRLSYRDGHPDWFDPEDPQRSMYIESLRRLMASSEEEPVSSQEERMAGIAGGLVEELESYAKSDESLNSSLGPICRDFEPLQRIDRLARAVAILNWYTSQSKKDLPALPGSVRRVREEVPSIWPVAAVFEDRGEGEPELARYEAPAAEDALTSDLVTDLTSEEAIGFDEEPYTEPSEEEEPESGPSVLVLLPILGVVALGGLWVWRRRA